MYEENPEANASSAKPRTVRRNEHRRFICLPGTRTWRPGTVMNTIKKIREAHYKRNPEKKRTPAMIAANRRRRQKTRLRMIAKLES